MESEDKRYKPSDHISGVTDVLLRLFVNRTDTYAFQNEDGTYTRINAPLTKDLLKRHLAGEITIGAYQLNRENKVKELVFDVDPEHVEDPKATTETILRECTQKPSPKEPRFWPRTVLLEASRYPDPSYHIRVLFEPEIKAAHARWIGLKILGFTGLSPAQVEVFPKQTELTDDRPYGNFVKLPLGYHRKERKRSCFLEHKSFKPLPPTTLLDVYGASFSESDLAKLDDVLEKQKTVQMGLPIQPLPESFRDLEKREEEEAAMLLAKHWRKHYRNRLEVAFLGWCLKNGVSYNSAYRIIDAVTSLCQDEEKQARLENVRYHYTRRRGLGSKLKGYIGLVEVIREVLKK